MGFYEPDELAGVRYAMPPYCGVGRYLVDPARGTWTKVKPGQWGACSVPTSLPAVASQRAPDELQRALDMGCGKVILCRQDGLQRTRLWCSLNPGESDWVDGPGVPDGEVVELVCGRVSLPVEGDFVEVLRQNGQQGFTNVKNLRLPDNVETHCASDELQCALDMGCGKVVLGRQDGLGWTQLWRSLNRGDWVDGLAVPDGEVVELVCGRVSHPVEGDFVEVLRPNGQQGFTKVKNLRLPDREPRRRWSNLLRRAALPC